ncbi:hypothetical protein [Acinetobacter radioresistens]|uniref:hypothetical protein n=1 Tax=Acinetobacter radioresistens TaxID=40216 RepID=UPI000E771055|nr:hypothetical protein [Acinetobacter radioresistens]RJL71656.1 hypothetical protein D5055_08405 [Acinetobacter radioresistens]
MKVIVVYNNVAKSSLHEILEKEYEGLANAYIPKVGEIVCVYSSHEHVDIEFKVTEIRTLIKPEYDRFDVLLEEVS